MWQRRVCPPCDRDGQHGHYHKVKARCGDTRPAGAVRSARGGEPETPTGHRTPSPGLPSNSSRCVALYACLSFCSCFSIFLFASRCAFSSMRWSSVLLLPKQPIFRYPRRIDDITIKRLKNKSLDFNLKRGKRKYPCEGEEKMVRRFPAALKKMIALNNPPRCKTAPDSNNPNKYVYYK